MRVDELERLVVERLKAGERPFYVNCTCGTTVLGAFDPVNAIADICAKYDMWLHIDAAWGGGCLLSPKLRHKLQGIERANSVTWNPHKLMGCVLQCSTIHFRDKVSVPGPSTGQYEPLALERRKTNRQQLGARTNRTS